MDIGAALLLPRTHNDYLDLYPRWHRCGIVMHNRGAVENQGGSRLYETKSSYTVTVTASDGNGGSDTITVTVNVTDVAENSAPVFTEGASTTRTVALPPKPENPGDMDIGVPLFATDADGDTLTYTLGGTDAALFHTYAFVNLSDLYNARGAVDNQRRVPLRWNQVLLYCHAYCLRR